MTKVVVAMSGGVDSSVAAALLKQQGHEVTGMMLRLWSEPGKEDSNRCCTPDSMAQARRVAAKLEIPFYVLDAKEIFRKTVVNYFLQGYADGQTPNPCLVCNREIRWEFLLQHALALGADFMATGHYARVDTAPDGRKLLRRGVDPAKDQSYVLHVLNQEKLARALFPAGDYTKPEIRAIAEGLGLSVAKRPDSQDLCFLAGEDYRPFLARNGAVTMGANTISAACGPVATVTPGPSVTPTPPPPVIPEPSSLLLLASGLTGLAGYVGLRLGSHAPHAIYNIGNSQSEDLMRVVELLEHATGRKALLDPQPMQIGDVKETFADISAIERDLGFEPKTTIEEGIPCFVDWYRHYHGVN